MARQTGLRGTVETALATMAEAGIELFHQRDVCAWAGVEDNSTLSNILHQLAKEHQIVTTRYAELNGNRGKVYAFNETRYNSNMREGAR